MKAIDFAAAIGEVEADYIAEAVDFMYGERQRIGSTRKALRTILIAAIIITLMAGAAYAIVVSRMDKRDVSEEAVSGTWNDQTLVLKNADLELSFDITADPCYEVEFKADWLPCEPESPYSPNREGWYTYLTNSGDMNGELPYLIQRHNGAMLKDIRYYFNCEMEVQLEDVWNGYRRTEMTGDYTNAQPAELATMRTKNYLLLFSEEDGYLIYIASSQYGFDVLEKIAENLEVELLDTVAEAPMSNNEIACLDLGRG